MISKIQKAFPAYKANAELSTFRSHGEVVEYHAMLHVDGSTDNYETQLLNIQQAYTELLDTCLPAGVVPVMMRYFLSDAANQTEGLEAELAKDSSPSPAAVSIVQQPPLDGSKIALWVYLLSDIVVLMDTPFDFSYCHGKYTHHWTGAQHVASGDSESQTYALLEKYEKNLEASGCNIADNCVRTWFFVQNVDVNYAGVVEARKENFIGQGLTDQTHYIASTGIEGRHANPEVHVLLDTYAVGGIETEQMKHLYALTHLSPTYDYGVTFERGVSMEYGDRKQLYISGTASIDHKGVVLHVGDVIAQTRRMWENVEKLLEEGGSSFDDVAQMIIYLRDVADYPEVKRMFDEQFPDVPKQIVLAPVCRPSWLIEMECIAVKEQKDERFEIF